MSARPPATRTVLLFGGSFDPPHRAHVELPLEVARMIGAQEVLFMPAQMNPQKADRPPTAVEHRLAMLERALQGHPLARISRLEIDHPGPSYTVDTLQRLIEDPDYAQATLRLLIGADQAVNFTTWKDWQTIEQIAEPVVMPRPPHFRAGLEQAYKGVFEGDWARWMSRTLDLSTREDRSTDIRGMIRRGDSLETVLSSEVERYVHEHRLYGWGGPPDRITT